MQTYFEYASLEENPRYSCVNNTMSYEEMAARHEKHPIIGGIFIVAGIFFEICYILSLSVIWSKEFVQMSCFKLMFCLGVVDCLCIVLSNFLSGFFYIVGFEYCMAPHMSFIMGALVNGFFNTCCMLCLFLVFNRLVDVWKPQFGEMLFKGGRTWIFVFLAVAYGIFFAIIPPPCLFNADYGTVIYHPLIPGKENLEYTSIYQTVANLITGTSICLCYVLIYVIHSIRMRGVDAKSQSRVQRKILIQAVCVCFFTFTTATIWGSLIFIPPYPFMMHLGQLSWELMHGMPAIVYLFLNKTIQRQAFRKVSDCLKMFNLI
ncbi:unnamed protein product, partial [Mesorhabditis belari]|uniref:Uncharacterized protein n=1 Tax=Mesorhabditis belari TaxID=2138241 RepID=A0AAF3EQU2_9BILA